MKEEDYKESIGKYFDVEPEHLELDELDMFRKLCSSIHAVMGVAQMEPYRVLWINDHRQEKTNGQNSTSKAHRFSDRIQGVKDFEEVGAEVFLQHRKNPTQRFAGLHLVKDGQGKQNWLFYTASTIQWDEEGQAAMVAIIAFAVEDIFKSPKMLKEFQKYIQFHINARERDKLTEKQRQVLKYLARGLSRKEIGQRMNISIYTVDDHKKALLKKFQCKNTSELIRNAQNMGLMMD